MYKGKRILALIPARAGSRGLPGKNIKVLAGKPLIAWTIIAAKKSQYIDEVIVSTDSKKIASIAAEYDAAVPFIRPDRLASSEAKGIDVVLHAIRWLEGQSQSYDIIILLQPTSPLRISEDIDEAIKLFFLKKAKTIVGVAECTHSPLWSAPLPENGCMKNFIKSKYINVNRQKLPVYYRLNGAIFIAGWNYIKKHKSFMGDKTFAYIMPKDRSVDIDDEIDLSFAEFLLKKSKETRFHEWPEAVGERV